MPSTNKCAYKGCSNTPSKCAECSFHRFPKDKNLQLGWISRIGSPELLRLTPQQLVNKRICSAHFQESDFFNYHRISGRRTLKGKAVPIPFTESNILMITDSLESPSKDKDPSEGTNGSCEQPPASPSPSQSSPPQPSSPQPSSPQPSLAEFSPTELSPSQLSPTVPSQPQPLPPPPSQPRPKKVTTKRYPLTAEEISKSKPLLTYREQKLTKRLTKLALQLKSARQTIRRLNKKLDNVPTIPKIIEGAAQYMDKDCLLLFSMQFDHMKHLAFNEAEKQFALDLFYKSPKTYKFLRDEKKITLPCVTLIRQWINELRP